MSMEEAGSQKMKAEENLEAMDLKCPRKLDINKPLLSTKRLNIIVADKPRPSNSSQRVPFSWEEAAGKPKDHSLNEEDQTPRLRLPPYLWNKESVADEDDHDHHLDDDFLSDNMEVFSLSEALDIVQKSEKARSDNHHSNEELRLKIEAESNNYGNQSPNYLIKRFLPDATALAASSSLHFSKSIMDNKICDSSSYLESYDNVTSPKGCGLEILFPWRLKHKLCALRSPVLPCSISMQKHDQHSSKQKKHHRHCTKWEDV